MSHAKVYPIDNDDLSAEGGDLPRKVPYDVEDDSEKESISPQGISPDDLHRRGDVGFGCMEKRFMPRGSSGLFQLMNTEAMKQKVRERRIKGPGYHVHQMYWETGMIQFIAKHDLFENITLGVIVANAIWIGLETDLNKSDSINEAHPIFVLGESCFFIYFTVELTIRFLAFKNKAKCFCDAWFVFDFTLVALYAFDPFALGIVASTGGGAVDLPTSILRLARLARLSRLVRMLRSFPELMIFVKGMVQSTNTVGYVVVLLLVITYVFAIALHNLVDKDKLIALDPGSGEDGPPSPPGFFSGVMESALSLMVYATFLDNLADFIYTVMDEDIPCWILCWLYIFVATMTVMNMLIGVLCTVIETVADEEKESMMVDKIYEKFQNFLDTDEFSDGTVTWEEFQTLMYTPDVIATLQSVQTDPETFIDIAEDLFFDDGVPLKLTFDQLMAIILDLRGGQEATIKHVMNMAKHTESKFCRVHARIDAFDRKLDAILAAL